MQGETEDTTITINSVTDTTDTHTKLGEDKDDIDNTVETDLAEYGNQK